MIDEYFAEPLLSIRNLFRDEQRRILDLLCDTTLSEAESAFRQLHERYDPLMRFHATLGVPLPKVLRTAAEFDVNMQLRRLLDADELPLSDIETVLRESRDEGVVLDEATLIALERAVERAALDFSEEPEDLERLERWEAIVGLVRGYEGISRSAFAAGWSSDRLYAIPAPSVLRSVSDDLSNDRAMTVPPPA